MVLDVVIAFFAVMFAALSVYGASAVSGLHVPAGVSLVLVAAEFALVMALMHAFVGLYRPQRLTAGAVIRRTVFAVACGGVVSYALWAFTTYSSVADELIFGSLLYLLAGLIVLRGVGRVARALAEAPRVLIVGTGPEALSVAQEVTGTTLTIADR